jgi:hypothetical protein
VTAESAGPSLALSPLFDAYPVLWKQSDPLAELRSRAPHAIDWATMSDIVPVLDAFEAAMDSRIARRHCDGSAPTLHSNAAARIQVASSSVGDARIAALESRGPIWTTALSAGGASTAATSLRITARAGLALCTRADDHKLIRHVSSDCAGTVCVMVIKYLAPTTLLNDDLDLDQNLWIALIYLWPLTQ